MVVVLEDGIKKDLHYTIAARLLKSGQAKLVEPEVKPKKRGRKPNN